MSILKESIFQVFIDGKQSGSPKKWHHTPLIVYSKWDAGTDQEKYEVLSALRRAYNPDNKNNIRGNERQLPAQIGRSEGFSELSYSRTSSALPKVIIVPGIMPYRRVEH
jgi:hypothetical protein